MTPHLNIGVDIEDVSRFEKLDMTADKTFLHNVFTPHELTHCFSKANKAEALAARFSAKESVVKALNACGAQGVTFSDIEIWNDKKRLPHVKIRGVCARRYDVRISISHTKSFVVTAAIASPLYDAR